MAAPKIDYTKWDIVVSASQLEMLNDCNRKWYGHYPRRLVRTPKTRAMVIGTCIHAVVERFLKRQPTYPEGWDLLPEIKSRLDGKEREMVYRMVEEAISNGHLLPHSGTQSELHFVRPIHGLGKRVAITGSIDIYSSGQIQDVKSRKNGNYSLTQEELASDIQLMLYGIVHAELHKEQGLPVPDAILSHIYLFKDAKEGKRSRRVETPELSASHFEEWHDTWLVPRLKEALRLQLDRPGWYDVEGAASKDSCFKYGQACPFVQHCSTGSTSPLPEEPMSVFKSARDKAATTGVAAQTPANPSPAAPAGVAAATGQIGKLLAGSRTASSAPASGSPAPATPATPATQAKSIGGIKARAAATASAAKPAQQAAPAEHPPVTEQPSARAPWADPACPSCGGIGLVLPTTDGCPVCDATARTRRAPARSLFEVIGTDTGIVIAPAAASKDLLEQMFPAEMLQPVLIEIVQPEPEHDEQAAEAVAAAEEDATEVSEEEQSLEGEEPQTEAPKRTLAESPKKGKRASKKTEGRPAEQSSPNARLILCRGVAPVGNHGYSTVHFAEVLAFAQAKVAEREGVPSYFEIQNVFGRREDLRHAVPSILEAFGDRVILAPEQLSADESALYGFLMPEEPLIWARLY